MKKRLRTTKYKGSTRKQRGPLEAPQGINVAHSPYTYLFDGSRTLAHLTPLFVQLKPNLRK